MIQYVLECVAFQLLFLIVYDLFLKRETFFQWNRVYLLGSFVLSILLPWIKIEALKTTVSQDSFVYPEYLWDMDMSSGFVGAAKPTVSFHFTTTEMVLYGGMIIAAGLFVFKLYQIIQLKRKGEIRYFESFTRVMVRNSQMAFSFFRSIFLGDQVLEKDHDSIIQHELVHIEQRHSWDLLFFELMRIVAWFNPLVYVYQNRISELHEFIADAKVAKTHKEEQYQMLLSQVFQTQNISFINHFYSSSLIKKRIVMLQKTKSKQIWRLKYLLMLPLVMGMLAYTSSEAQENDLENIALPEIVVNGLENATISKSSNWNRADLEVMDRIPVFTSCDKEADRNGCFETEFKSVVLENLKYPTEAKGKGIQGTVFAMFTIGIDGKIGELRFRGPDEILEDEVKRVISNLPPMISGEHQGKKVAATFTIPITFKLDSEDREISKVLKKKDEADIPIFPGCEDAEDKKACFEAMMRKHIAKNFHFDKEQAKKDFEERVAESIRNNPTYSKYNALVMERERLLENTDENNPAVIKLDRQIKALRSKIDANDIDIPFVVVEKVPVFPSCENAEDKRACFNEMMYKHISTNFRYPEEAQENGIQGRVSVMFIIGEDGSIGNVKMRGPDKLLEDEAARIISLLPKMTPGEHGGKAVRVPFSIPITFKLEGENKESSRTMENQEDIDIPFAVVEKVPVFPGCENAEDKRVCFNEKLQLHIAENFKYPEEAHKKGIQGRVNIVFLIQKDGSIGGIRMRGPDKILEEEAARIISLLPKMTPGEYRGNKVSVPYVIPITFNLQ
ncbi:M56 family metallopeptidase [Arenibacter sp. 6A1]|uniref:M56 family metallopeptidase n=1 Tax=Arenibacter sp. 6A1 TaxID=2720391 RepID=UPI001F0E47FB|nr:M56 family metallopeptidase [Arenibacter sp. 6A1]